MSKQITCNDEQLQVLIDHERQKMELLSPPTTVEESKAVTRTLKFIANCESGLTSATATPDAGGASASAGTQSAAAPGQDVSQG